MPLKGFPLHSRQTYRLSSCALSGAASDQSAGISRRSPRLVTGMQVEFPLNLNERIRWPYAGRVVTEISRDGEADSNLTKGNGEKRAGIEHS